MPPVITAAAALFLAGTVTAAANSTAGGPDYIGLAALISAGAGAVGTLVMSYLAVVRRRNDVPLTPEQMAEAFREAMKDKP